MIAMKWVLGGLLLCCGTVAGAQSRNGASPAVAPDGRRIAFVSDRTGPAELFVMNADGSGVRQLTRHGVNVGGPAWTADGRRIRHSLARGDTLVVFEVGVDDAAVREVARLRAKRAQFTADDSLAVIADGPWSAMQLHSVKRDGTPVRRLTNDAAAWWCHALSPDGRSVAANRVAKEEGMQIWLVAVDGSAPPRPLTGFTPADGRPQCPAWSPDGALLVVQSAAPVPEEPSKRRGHLWLVEAATGRATRLAPHDAAYLDEVPAWFPDGRRIAFQSDRTGRWEIYTMASDGTDLRQLTR